jgi:hypothetical protein
MMEGVPLVAHFAMGTRQGNGGTLSAVRTLLAAILDLAEEFDALEPFAVVPGVLNVLTRRQGGKVQDAQVQPHSRFSGWQRDFFWHLTGEGDVPVVDIAPDGDRFDGARERSMQLHLYLTYPRQVQAIPVQLPSSHVRIGKRVVAATPLETRVARLLAVPEASEEGGEGFIQAAQHILQDMGGQLLVGWNGLLQDGT